MLDKVIPVSKFIKWLDSSDSALYYKHRKYENDTDDNSIECWKLDRIRDYVNFITQPLKLNMFIPTFYTHIILEDIMAHTPIDFITNKYDKLKIYKECEGHILFKNWMFIPEDRQYCMNGIFNTLDPTKRKDVYKIHLEGRAHQYQGRTNHKLCLAHWINTIEEFITDLQNPIELELTEQALIQLNLFTN